MLELDHGPDSRPDYRSRRSFRQLLLVPIVLVSPARFRGVESGACKPPVLENAMTTRIVTTAFSALLLIGSSTVWGAEEKPPKGSQQTDEAQMKKHCEDMMKGKDMSNMSAAEHEAMMKRCREMMKDQDANKKKPE